MDTLKDLWASLVAYAHERTTNPFTTAFVLSWSLVNYKFFVLILSDEKPTEKFAQIAILFPQPEIYWSASFLIPLAASLFYVFLYPGFTTWVVMPYRTKQVELSNSLKGVEYKRLKTPQQLESMIRRHETEVRDLQKRITESGDQIEELRLALAAAEKSEDETQELRLALAAAEKNVSGSATSTQGTQNDTDMRLGKGGVGSLLPPFPKAAFGNPAVPMKEDAFITLSIGTTIGLRQGNPFTVRELRLMTLLCNNAHLTQEAVPDALGVDISMVGPLIDRLMQRNVITPDGVLLKVTAEGREVIDQLVKETKWTLVV